ncbi:MAG: NTP transferase domain-containing protein [Chloroflexi bacterium]|nr:NTP transferase domain-containing protein [Chloroflexota bacterium]
MKAVILAAGEGKRMRPLTYTRPKVMLPLANQPILEHLLIEAREAGIKDFIFIVGYRDEQVRDYFGRGERWGINIEYCQQQRQLGTADAIMMAQGLVGDSFLVMNGDIIVSRKDIKDQSLMEGNVLGLFEVEDTRGLGVVQVSQDRILHIYEKVLAPPSRLANAGLYRFTTGIFDAIARTPKSPRGEYEIPAAIQLMIDTGSKVSYRKLDSWLDLSYPWDLLAVNERLLARAEPACSGEIETNVMIKGNVRIGANTIIRSGSYIVGPVIIGEGCDIGPNCYLRPGTAIGDECHIGSAVEVKNSIIMRGSKIPHHNYVGDSVIGEKCNFGSGTKVANLRLDKKPVRVEDIDTGRRKLGVIVGDDVETGINASLNVGSLIGNGARIGPGTVASGVIAPYARIF